MVFAQAAETSNFRGSEASLGGGGHRLNSSSDISERHTRRRECRETDPSYEKKGERTLTERLRTE
jgi:hypothetical protein